MKLDDMVKELKKHEKSEQGLEILMKKAKELGVEGMYLELSINDQLALIEELESHDFNEICQAFEKKHLNAELDVRLEKNQQKHRYERSI